MGRTTCVPVTLVLLVLAACTSGPSKEDQGRTTDSSSVAGPSTVTVPSGVTRAPGGAPTKLALLVGINTYPQLSKFSQLEGAVNDVERMRSLLTTTFEFPPENVMVLVDGEATRANILAAFRQHLVAKARAGDIVVFHYSGHGAQVDDEPNGDELDGVDETLVPADSDRHGTRDIRDDEVNALIAGVNPEARLTLIFDSCHSGTASRDLEGGRARSVNRDSLLHPTPGSGTRGQEHTEGLGVADMDYVLLSGARSDQQAKEFNKEGQTFGALTYFLTETLSQADSLMTYTDLRDVVQGQVSAHFANQSPQLEGPTSDFYVFSDTSSRAQPHVRVGPLEGTDRVRLEAGQVHGMTVGSVFDVYPPGTKRFEVPNVPIARARITRVDPFTSEAEVLSGGGPIPAAARAVEREHVYADLRMNLRYEGLAGSAVLRAVKDSLDALSHIQAVPEDSDDFQLRLYEQDGDVHIRHDEVVFSEPVSTTAPDAVEHLVEQVRQWAKWFNVWGIEDAAPDAPVVLHLRFDDPNAGRGRPWNEVEEGSGFWYSFENRSDQDLFITGIALFSTGAIQPFYPHPPGAGVLLKAGATSREIRIRRLSVAEGRPFARDILKVFATTTPVDLSSLIQGKIRGGLDDPLASLVAQATQGATRDFTPEAVGDWYTTQQAYVVRRAASSPAM